MKRVGKNWIYKFKRWLNTWTIWYDMISFNTIQLCHSVNLWSSTWIGKTILYNLTGLKKTSRSSELAIGPLGNLPFRWGAPKVLWESASWKRSMIVSMIDGWLDPMVGWWMVDGFILIRFGPTFGSKMRDVKNVKFLSKSHQISRYQRWKDTKRACLLKSISIISCASFTNCINSKAAQWECVSLNMALGTRDGLAGGVRSVIRFSADLDLACDVYHLWNFIRVSWRGNLIYFTAKFCA